MTRARTIGSWILAILLAFVFIQVGLLKFLASDGWISRFAAWGYPAWFVYVIGVMEAVGGVLVLVPATLRYGAGLIVVTMLGAAATHLVSGIGSPLSPLVFIALCALLVWLRRPASPAAVVA